MAKLFAFVLAATADARLLKANRTQIPISQTVAIGNVEVYSESAGHQNLNECLDFAPMIVKDPSQPVVTVCGSQTKVTVFLRARCTKYDHYQEEIGICDTSAGEGCATMGPSMQHWMSTAQSYMIEQCATSTQ